MSKTFSIEVVVDGDVPTIEGETEVESMHQMTASVLRMNGVEATRISVEMEGDDE